MVVVAVASIPAVVVAVPVAVVMSASPKSPPFDFRSKPPQNNQCRVSGIMQQHNVKLLVGVAELEIAAGSVGGVDCSEGVDCSDVKVLVRGHSNPFEKGEFT
jgi:hypothetical protein